MIKWAERILVRVRKSESRSNEHVGKMRYLVSKKVCLFAALPIGGGPVQVCWDMLVMMSKMLMLLMIVLSMVPRRVRAVDRIGRGGRRGQRQRVHPLNRGSCNTSKAQGCFSLLFSFLFFFYYYFFYFFIILMLILKWLIKNISRGSDGIETTRIMTFVLTHRLTFGSYFWTQTFAFDFSMRFQK